MSLVGYRMGLLTKPTIDSKTDLATGIDEQFHQVFKFPAVNFIRLCKDMSHEQMREFVSRLGCHYELDGILKLDLATIDDPHFGQGIAITVHGTHNPYLAKCDNCSLNFDTGES